MTNINNSPAPSTLQPTEEEASDGTEHFDLIIVGSGSGNSIPEYLADWKIALVERDVFGGTCLNRGCIPSKMFVLPADVAQAAKNSAHLGIETSYAGADWPAIRDRVFGLIDPIAAGGEEYRATGTPNVTLIQGTARFVGDKTFDVDGRSISATRVLIAAGSRPTLPSIDGLDATRHHTSDSIMRLDELPGRLGVIGGGFIAVEMGHVFAGLGSNVIMFNRSEQLLRVHDAAISERFTEVFGARDGVDLRLGQLPTRVEETSEGTILLHLDDEVLEVDELLIATGRRPNSDLLDATAGGVDLLANERISVNLRMETNVDDVWAIGDVANEYQLKHVANAEVKVAFWNMAHPAEQHEVDYTAVPSAVFSGPQVASVGKTEEQLVADGTDYRVGTRDFGGTAYGWALNDNSSFAKVLVDDASDLILGAHIIGPQASSLLQPIIQAMQFGQTASDLATKVFYIHPALTEVVENALLEAGSSS